ncbi:MAG: 50S ribosomal protein L2 [Candidatus Aenigmatarchaeota archaeon]|nr:MAG: 50S ribosomal protein L2 [Candidatus Aenigmarchaeota archaeon]
MGKRIIQQRRGKGSFTYRVRKANFKVRLEYRNSKGVVRDIQQDPGRVTPVALVEYEDGTKGYIPAREGMSINDTLEGVVMPLSDIPESKPIFAIESAPNTGPVFCRSGGSFAFIVSKDRKNCVVQFPSKKTKTLNLKCKAIVGVPAGSGRGEKPWVKAGPRWIAMHKKGRLYPLTSANAMNAVDHPFGGSYSGVNKPKTVSRNAPPGRKVGTIASKKTGRKKK